MLVSDKIYSVNDFRIDSQRGYSNLFMNEFIDYLIHCLFTCGTPQLDPNSSALKPLEGFIPVWDTLGIMSENIISSKVLSEIWYFLELKQLNITDSNIWRSKPSPAAFFAECQANMASIIPDLENVEVKI